jgi:hypothetical protein
MKLIQSRLLGKIFVLVGMLGYSSISLAATGAFETNVAVDGPAIVDVSNLSGAVVVRGGDVDEITIRARITVDKRTSKTDPLKAGRMIEAIQRSPPVVTDGNRVIITALKKRTQQRHVSISYEIVVPRDAAVNVRSVSGDVQVSGVEGHVNAESESGKVIQAG